MICCLCEDATCLKQKNVPNTWAEHKNTNLGTVSLRGQQIMRFDHLGGEAATNYHSTHARHNNQDVSPPDP